MNSNSYFLGDDQMVKITLLTALLSPSIIGCGIESRENSDTASGSSAEAKDNSFNTKNFELDGPPNFLAQYALGEYRGLTDKGDLIQIVFQLDSLKFKVLRSRESEISSSKPTVVDLPEIDGRLDFRSTEGNWHCGRQPTNCSFSIVANGMRYSYDFTTRVDGKLMFSINHWISDQIDPRPRGWDSALLSKLD
jgi:hypothetical protein